VTRLLVLLAAIAAALTIAPAAWAATYTVNDPGDAPDDNGADLVCDTDIGTIGLQCTLRAAVQQANFTVAAADTIGFSGAGQAPAPATALDAVTSPLTIDGDGATTVTFGAAAAGPLIDFQASDSTLRAITVSGGGSGDAVRIAGGAGRLDSATIRSVPGNGVRLSGSGARVDASRVESTGLAGIVVEGSNATLASPVVTSAGGDGISISGSGAAVTSPLISGGNIGGIRISGDGVSVSGGRIHHNGENGVTMSGQNDSVSRVVFFANGGRAIASAPGANGGIAPPQNLRIGPRRADGSLPLSGTASGTVELWRGDPSSTSEPGLVDAFGASGDFTYAFGSEPAPGSVFAASVTGGGTSEFATVAVPNDVSSPSVITSRALDTTQVRVDASEPLDPGSVQKEDFTLTMAGKPRAIDAATVAPDGRFVILSSSGWKAGEAGYVDLGPAGAIADAAGNSTLTGARLRVFAAPGDFVAPLGARLAITPKTICLTRGRGCRTPGMTIKFMTTEPGKAALVVKRGNVQIGRRVYGNILAGANTLKFNGRLGARKLRAGRYRLLMYVQDMVGNVTDQPPIQLFSVRRVTK
jgi:hypothetical protein